jgi:hypothetical protein
MAYTKCNQCGGLIITETDTTCPRCRSRIDVGHINSGSPSDKRSGVTSERPRRTIRDIIASRAKGGIFIGIALALLGYFGGSYQRRGAGYTSSGMELVWVGISVAVFSTVIFLLCRRKSID